MKFFYLFFLLFPLIAHATPIWMTPDTVLLPIDTPSDTATTLFQKNGIHYLVFNQPDIQVLDFPNADFAGAFQNIPQSEPVSVFSFRLHPNYEASLLHPSDTRWILEITPHQQPFSLIKGKITPSELTLNTPLSQPPFWINIPELEKDILIIPFQNNTGGIPKRIDFLRLSLLQSAQGLAIDSQTPLHIQHTPTQTHLTGQEPLASLNAFFPLFLPSFEASAFKPQRARFIRYASFVSKEDLPLFYQNMGILFLLNGHYQPAETYMRSAPQIHPFWPAFNALMRHQNQQAASLLQEINDVPEISYLKQLLAGQKQPLPAFLKQLPQQMQEPLLQMGLQNALTAFDIPLAQIYLNAWQQLPPTSQRTHIQTWAHHWMRFIAGDKTPLPFLSQKTNHVLYFARPLWNHLFENAPIYHLNDMETLALFEEVRPLLESDLTPPARQKLAEAYQRLNLPQEALHLKNSTKNLNLP